MSALYQRARPFTFDQVVGQEHVKDVLASAVARGLTGHAYLFSGPRGVGKTTTARLMAMAVNCEREPAERPCGTCESCRMVRDGAHPDVLELDAASNNSVEDVRALRERAGLASLRGGTRVWILDEAHMLSRAAANALLKTLEEPPPGLMFVLATTEPEKLPPTILSRCQHFRFRRLTDAEILGKLTRLCAEAGVEAEEDALSLVARAAEGAMRDAESLLERLLIGGGPITAAAAEDALGLPPRERLAELAGALLEGDLARLLPQAGDLYRAGFAPRTVAEQLGRTLRDRLHEALSSGSADETRLVALIHALDEELERFNRRDDLYGLEVALIKASGAGRRHEAADEAGRRADASATRRRPAGQGPVTREPAPAAAAAQEEPPAEPVAPGAHGDDGRATAGAPAESPAADAAAPTGRRSFSWHAVRSAATPQLKAFLQPARAEVDGAVITLEYDERYRFHCEQVLARRAELEQLVASVAGPGYTVNVKGPRGGGSARRRTAAEAPRAPVAATAGAPPARPAEEPRPADQSSTSEASAEPAPAEAAPPPGADEPGQPAEEDEPHEALPPGFWDDAYDEGAPADAEEAPPSLGVAPGTSLDLLQRLFPGRVIEFRPRAAPEGDAAPDAEADAAQGYDDEGQDRLEFGALAPDER